MVASQYNDLSGGIYVEHTRTQLWQWGGGGGTSGLLNCF